MTTTSNPVLGAFGRVEAKRQSYTSSALMTVEGTIIKAGILGLLFLLAFEFVWIEGKSHSSVLGLGFIGGVVGGILLGIIIAWSPKTAPLLSPVYAALQGSWLGAFSFFVAQDGGAQIVFQAGFLTIATLFVLLVAYRTGLIVVNNQFRAILVGATASIGGYYLLAIVLMLFHIQLPGIGFQGGWFSVVLSAIIVIVAAFNLVLDFDYIAKNSGVAPKYMEWYGAFSLIVTLIWLYFEILRLLMKLRGK
jgi:uncharacterized YccA/Bax inhibitor family protein